MVLAKLNTLQVFGKLVKVQHCPRNGKSESHSNATGKLGRRMAAVLKETRHRGFVVERLTREYVRVYTALRALTGDGEIDVITTQLARAFADLAIIDVLPAELAGTAAISVATVSAPITDADGTTSMSVTAAAFTMLDGDAIYSLGEQVRDTAQRIEQHIARYGNSAAI